jgi:hypothetical protein
LHADNDSKGCGGVMRAAPVGLIANSPETAFELGCETAALTHGHPSGQLPAGVLAAAIHLLMDDVPLPEALTRGRRLLPDDDADDPRIGETGAALDAAFALAASEPLAPEAVERLGGGWIGEEALAIAAYCALAAPDPLAGLLASVNHSGDSDSTGSICGNLLGAAHGTAAVPRSLFERLDLADVVTRMADDLWFQISESPDDEHDAFRLQVELVPGLVTTGRYSHATSNSRRAPTACESDVLLDVVEEIRSGAVAAHMVEQSPPELILVDEHREVHVVGEPSAFERQAQASLHRRGMDAANRGMEGTDRTQHMEPVGRDGNPIRHMDDRACQHHHRS